MYTKHHYDLPQTLSWSRRSIIYPLLWASVATFVYEYLGWRFLGLPTLPMSLIGIAVAFYLGFKNNASYDRLWEARKIWGAIVNASRSWAYSARDLISNQHGGDASAEELAALSTQFVHRHIAWMDALRHQLRKIKPWEHSNEKYGWLRESVPEYKENLEEVLAANIGAEEAAEVVGMINPAAHLLAKQSAQLAQCRKDGLLDGFAHMELQKLLNELMTQQGKAERIKNFPFPRQYATVNYFFAVLFTALLPFGLLPKFAEAGPNMAWLTVPFAAIVSWVFLTTDQIGEWSENPFEGFANDVPITSMARGIERDMRQIIGETELPEPRKLSGFTQY